MISMKYIWFCEKTKNEGYLIVKGKNKKVCMDLASDLLEKVYLVNWYEVN